MRHIDLELRADHIALDALLKATGLASSGGEAKATVTAGKVEVDGQVELRRGRKVRAGQVVAVHGARVRVKAPRSIDAADTVDAASAPRKGEVSRSATPHDAAGPAVPVPDATMPVTDATVPVADAKG